MINKPFGDEINSLGCALYLYDITPSDASDLPVATRLIYVGVGGDISLLDTRGNTVLHKNIASGSYLGPFYIARVLSTNTTASNLIGYV